LVKCFLTASLLLSFKGAGGAAREPETQRFPASETVQ
jgi:hypothetical protein